MKKKQSEKHPIPLPPQKNPKPIKSYLLWLPILLGALSTLCL